ncbi:hypothetical protein EYF80_020773 [Liparis tanakae]|uniref:Uncharacterized protein n=1 Tax=Liparis tanakae TaxID=230148 RepID=A0A4Z2HVH7_9TELE|nr:hypothetical protein EYF80_020773 [Liparis tanakae]
MFWDEVQVNASTAPREDGVRREEVDEGIQTGVEVHQAHGDVQRHLEGREVGAVGAGRQLADHVLQEVDVVGAEAHHEHQGHAADHADGLAAAAGLVRQVVALGRGVQLGAQDGVAHQDGHHWNDVTQEDGADQYGGDVVHPLEVGVLHAGDEAVRLPVGHRHADEGEGLRQHQQPDAHADVAHVAHFPESGEAQRQHHSDEAVHAEAGHEVDAGVGVDVEDESRDLARRLAQRPVEAQGVVDDPHGQREGEEDVGDDQVEGVQGGGVHLLHVGADDVEGEAVPEQPHQEHHAVEERHEHLGVVPVGVQGVTGGVVAGWDGDAHGRSSGTHLDVFGNQELQMKGQYKEKCS